jgi:hypothetical protein
MLFGRDMHSVLGRELRISRPQNKICAVRAQRWSAYTSKEAPISIHSREAYSCNRDLRLDRKGGLQEVHRALDTPAAPVEDVGVDHRRLHALVAEELLDGPDVVAVHQEVGGEGVAEGMAGRRLDEAGGPERVVEGLLAAPVVEVITVGSTGRPPSCRLRCVSGPEGRRDRARGFSPGAGATPPSGVPEGRREPPAGRCREVGDVRLSSFQPDSSRHRTALDAGERRAIRRIADLLAGDDHGQPDVGLRGEAGSLYLATGLAKGIGGGRAAIVRPFPAPIEADPIAAGQLERR